MEHPIEQWPFNAWVSHIYMESSVALGKTETLRSNTSQSNLDVWQGDTTNIWHGKGHIAPIIRLDECFFQYWDMYICLYKGDLLCGLLVRGTAPGLGPDAASYNMAGNHRCLCARAGPTNNPQPLLDIETTWYWDNLRDSASALYFRQAE